MYFKACFKKIIWNLYDHYVKGYLESLSFVSGNTGRRFGRSHSHPVTHSSSVLHGSESGAESEAVEDEHGDEGDNP